MAEAATNTALRARSRKAGLRRPRAPRLLVVDPDEPDASRRPLAQAH